MVRTGFALLMWLLIACNNKKIIDKQNDGFSFTQFSEQFPAVKLPYQLTNTGLLNNADTITIHSTEFAGFIPDSIKTSLFGKSKVKYFPLAKIKTAQSTVFYIVKAENENKKAALLIAFNKNQFGATLPFLVPDNDATTTQSSSVDRSFSISKNVTQKRANDFGEGKEVYEYDAAAKKFSLIMTNPLNNNTVAVINPIDTLPRKNRFSADYIKDKKNFISIRDGRHPNQLLVFIHVDKDSGGCTGELKGDLLLTSSATAIYRQGGDPCVLSFKFTPSSVTVKEDEGCGSHRGLNCVFDDIFQRKKIIKSKQIHKKTVAK